MIAENELSGPTRDCLVHRRIPVVASLAEEAAARVEDVRFQQRTVDWQMKLDDAHCRLKALSPKIQADQSIRAVQSKRCPPEIKIPRR